MFTIVDPTTIPDWDDRLKDLPGVSFFHGAAWARVLHKAYGYSPSYFAVEKDAHVAAVIPLMEVSSILTGKRAVGLPFTDYCEPLTPHIEVSKVLFEAIVREGKRRGWKYIELRGGADFFGDAKASAFYYRHTLNLTPGVDKLFNGFRDSTRRNIRKAEKEGVEVRFETSLDTLRDFYRLNCLTRREHGLPPQPWQFFLNVHKEIISAGKGVILLGYYEGIPVAANVYLHSNGDALYKYGASDKAHQHLRASNLVMWEAIKRYAESGFRSLCFGRTEPENEGLRQFKTGWGADETVINYYRYDLARNAFVTGDKGVSARAHQVFSRMPIPALKAVGNLLYRHMG